MLLARSIAHVDRYLAVVHLAEPTQPLTLYTHRIIAALLVPLGIEYYHCVIFSQLRTYLPCQFFQQRPVIPRHRTYEALQSLPIQIVAVPGNFGPMRKVFDSWVFRD